MLDKNLCYFLFAAVDKCLSSPCKNRATCTRNIDTYICKCPPGFHGYNCEKGWKSLLMFSIGAEEVSVIIVPLQCVQTPPAVATEMEDVNISVESFRMALPYAFVLRDTDLNWTTVPACLKV